jgi:hypothetical protein
MMIEPPGDLGIGGILEIDNGILVAIEEAVIEKLGGPMRQPGIDEFRVRVESALEESAEIGRRGSAVKTVVVIEDSYPHLQAENLTA